jgi:hypothetical protein
VSTTSRSSNTDKNFEIGTHKVSRLTALRVLKDAIMIASMDGNFSLPEKQKVYTYAEKLDIPRTDVDNLETLVENSKSWINAGRNWLPATPMSKSGFSAPLFAYADQAMAYCKAGLQLSGWRFGEALDPWFPLAVFLICSMLMVFA